MLRACVQRFDVTRNLEKFCKILGTKQHLGKGMGGWFWELGWNPSVVLGWDPSVGFSGSLRRRKISPS